MRLHRIAVWLEGLPNAVRPHLSALRAAGASRFSLYHLGLAPAWRQGLISWSSSWLSEPHDHGGAQPGAAA